MNIEAKLSWILGSIMIVGYTIIAWILHTSWVAYGLEPEWWVTIVPWFVFTIATILMFIITYKTCEKPLTHIGDCDGL